MIPGEILVDDSQGEIIANAGRATAVVTVSNTGDRPIQVGSHFHFFEANRALRFDRQAAYGMRLNIAAGTAVRFEPGETKPVALVALAGERVDLRPQWLGRRRPGCGRRARPCAGVGRTLFG